MNSTSMKATRTNTLVSDTLEVPGARLHYELRGSGPLVALVGAPMDAQAFEPLAEALAAAHTVLTMDPRGINRSRVDNPDEDSTPQTRADDLARLLVHLSTGPATVFGSSGGAVSALALTQTRPDLVGTLIAHEPPLDELLEGREEIHAQTDDIVATYLAGDTSGAWRRFLAQADITMPEEVFQGMFAGDRDPQVVADERFWFAHELRPTTHWQPDIAALRHVATRIIVGIGADSAGQACDRTSAELARTLGIERTTFPGGHVGFVDQPAGFATTLLRLL